MSGSAGAEVGEGRGLPGWGTSVLTSIHPFVHICRGRHQGDREGGHCRTDGTQGGHLFSQGEGKFQEKQGVRLLVREGGRVGNLQSWQHPHQLAFGESPTTRKKKRKSRTTVT